MKNLIYILLLCASIYSCKKDEVELESKYESGLIILNEGPFGSGSGSVGFWDRITQESIEDAFALENNGAVIGNILQSLTKVENKYYFIVNNANKIIVTDVQFKFEKEINGFELPRFMVTRGNMAYVTQWGNDGINGSLAILDLMTNSIVKSIPLGKGPENMLLKDDKLYISLVGGYDRDNRVLVFDLTSESIIKTIYVDDNPAQLLEFGNDILVLCKGFNDFLTPSNSTTGSILKLSSDTVVSNVDLLDFADNLIKTNNPANFYFTINGQPSLFNAINNDVESKPVSAYIYKLGYDTKDNKLLLLDAGDFTSRGKVYVTDLNLKFTDTIQAGLIPTAVYTVD